ncbi:hypothetical protein KR215_009911, partial [Drosophila sulfurigaster]
SSRGTRNLQQIFEDDDRPLQSESNNLRYQPTQQKSQTAPTTATASTTTTTANSNRNNNKSTTTAEPKWSTLVAKVANGYNGNESVGRVGVALSRNVVGAAKLVIYKSRSQLLSSLLLTKSTTSSSPGEGASRLLMRASYMQFYDDEQRFWSLRFEAAVDEVEFTDALISLGLPIDQKQPEKAQQNAKEEQQASTSSAASTASTAASAAGTPRSFQRFKEFEASSCDSDSESTQSNEENILTLRTPSKALIPVAATTSSAAPSSGNKLEAYLHEQRANGEAIDRKMDTLLQAMCRLTAANHSSSNSNSVVSNSASTLNIESVNDVADNDNEDELLELEQKLLDYKKQNRVLAKSLKQREQEMMVLRASTCNLCDKMRNQNNELKKQNRTLIAALADKMKSDDQHDDDAAGNSSCMQCDKYLKRIRELEQRVQLLQAVVLDYSKDIKSSSISNSSGLL